MSRFGRFFSNFPGALRVYWVYELGLKCSRAYRSWFLPSGDSLIV